MGADSQAVSVVIVSHNTADLLRQCLTSLAAPDSRLETWVVDNASEDGSVDLLTEFPDVHLIRNDENVGFGVANNQGVARVRTEFTLLLNSDTVVLPQAISTLRGALASDPCVGLVGPQLLNGDATVQRSAFRFPGPLVTLIEQAGLARYFPSVSYRMADSLTGDSISIDWLKGACLLGRTALLRRLGPFDPRFFMYGEDVDLCYRMRLHGLDVRLVPNAQIIHLGGQSARRYGGGMVLQFVASTYLLYLKHWPSRVHTIVLVFRLIASIKWARDFIRLWFARLGRDLDARAQLERDLRLWRGIMRLPPKGKTSAFTTLGR